LKAVVHRNNGLITWCSLFCIKFFIQTRHHRRALFSFLLFTLYLFIFFNKLH